MHALIEQYLDCVERLAAARGLERTPERRQLRRYCGGSPATARGIVLTTSSTFRQIRTQLWAEIHRLVERSPMITKPRISSWPISETRSAI